ncbi:hypothetical protein SDJN03_09801, partial [Cucurbita argyrosperma subsp. sororia]
MTCSGSCGAIMGGLRCCGGGCGGCCLSSPSPEQPGILVYHGCSLNSPLPPVKSNGLLAISSKYLIRGVALIQQGDLLPSLKPALVTAGS